MTDELLIKFIEGKTTPEETEIVLKELSQDGDAAKEWLQMVEGTRLADTKPLMDIDSEDFIAKTLAEKSGKQQTERKTVRLPWMISAVAAAAACIAIVVTIMTGIDNGGQLPSNDIIAEGEPETEVLIDSASADVNDIADIKSSSREMISETISPEVKDAGEEAENFEETEEITGRKIILDDNTATASQDINPTFEMVKPAKSLYRVKVRNPEKEFVFEWKMNDVRNIRLTIADKEGSVLINKDNISGNRFGVVASALVDKGELEWTMEVTFNDGSMQKKAGKLELVSVKN